MKSFVIITSLMVCSFVAVNSIVFSVEEHDLNFLNRLKMFNVPNEKVKNTTYNSDLAQLADKYARNCDRPEQVVANHSLPYRIIYGESHQKEGLTIEKGYVWGFVNYATETLCKCTDGKTTCLNPNQLKFDYKLEIGCAYNDDCVRCVQKKLIVCLFGVRNQ